MFSEQYHINITKSGRICIPHLQNDGWNPQFRTRDIIQQTIELLIKPNLSNPFLLDHTTETKLIQYSENRELFTIIAMEYTKQYARNIEAITNKDNYKHIFKEPTIVKWKQIRQVWIAFYKNDKNNNCLIHLLPKDIVKSIIKLVAIYVI